MNSVERVKEYEKLPQEKPDIINNNRPPDNWPENGKITFENVNFKYREV